MFRVVRQLQLVEPVLICQVAGIRFGGVYFPANGKFYAMGGRDLRTGGIEFTNPFEYDPVSNSWTTKAATYPDPA